MSNEENVKYEQNADYALGYWAVPILTRISPQSFARAKSQLEDIRKTTYLRQTMSPEQAAQIPPDIVEVEDSVKESSDFDVDEMQQLGENNEAGNPAEITYCSTQLTQLTKWFNPAEGYFDKDMSRSNYKWIRFPKN